MTNVILYIVDSKRYVYYIEKSVTVLLDLNLSVIIHIPWLDLTFHTLKASWSTEYFVEINTLLDNAIKD